MSPSRAIAVAVAADLVGAAVAARLDLVGEPFRIRLPLRLPPAVEIVGYGTALSGPLLADAALVASCRWDVGRRDRVLTALGWLRLVGVLSEPATWGRRRPRWTVAISAAQVVAAVGLVLS